MKVQLYCATKNLKQGKTNNGLSLNILKKSIVSKTWFERNFVIISVLLFNGFSSYKLQPYFLNFVMFTRPFLKI